MATIEAAVAAADTIAPQPVDPTVAVGEELPGDREATQAANAAQLQEATSKLKHLRLLHNEALEAMTSHFKRSEKKLEAEIRGLGGVDELSELAASAKPKGRGGKRGSASEAPDAADAAAPPAKKGRGKAQVGASADAAASSSGGDAVAAALPDNGSVAMLNWLKSCKPLKKDASLKKFTKEGFLLDDVDDQSLALAVATFAKISAAITGLHEDAAMQLTLAQQAFGQCPRTFSSAAEFAQAWLTQIEALPRAIADVPMADHTEAAEPHVVMTPEEVGVAFRKKVKVLPASLR